MKIINLIEDTPGKPGCKNEHGLSFYIETKGHRILMDAGATSAFLENAKALGIDLGQVDTVILSHGHYDHSGGIMPFVEINPLAKIYMQKTAGEFYYSLREKGETYIGIDRRIPELLQVCMVTGNRRIDDELFLFSEIKGRRFWPESNQRLKCRIGETLVQDIFLHEQCLVVEEEGKKILLSGCAHNGILNILDRFREIFQCDPDAVISGFHMIQKNGCTKEQAEVIRNTARELAGTKTIFYTGHCTGRQAFTWMKEIMGEQLREIHSGDRLE